MKLTRNIFESEEATRSFYKALGMRAKTAERAIAMAKAAVDRTVPVNCYTRTRRATKRTSPNGEQKRCVSLL
jgi:hypothetical protein